LRALKYIILVAAVAAIVLGLTGDYAASAQCAMCRASLAGSNNASFIRNLNIGVLVLLVPPVTIFCSIFIILKRRGGGNH
jgi:hypothetical protein